MGEIRAYSGKELMGSSLPALPGWRYPATLPIMAKSVARSSGWLPALVVSIFRDNPDVSGEIQTLTAIRGKSTTHEEVVSTLTAQFPAALLRLLVAQHERYVIGEYPRVAIGRDGPDPRETAVVASYRPNLEGIPEQGDVLPYLTHDIFARKLGRVDLISMRSDDELGTVSLARMTTGVSYVKDNAQGEPQFERLLMVGLAVMLHPHHADVFDADYHERMSVLPPEERRYRSLGWTSINSFTDNVRHKNVIKLAPYITEGEAVEACVDGQCLAMTSLVIDAPDLLWHLGRADPGTLHYGQAVGDPYGAVQEAFMNRKGYYIPYPSILSGGDMSVQPVL